MSVKSVVDPKVTVVTAVYNGEKYIAECIDSVLSQTFEDFEFIIVDDASTDGTTDILKKYACVDRRIKYITNSVNSERCFSRNIAVSCASSELIAIIDADDVALPDRLSKQFNFMMNNHHIAVLGGAMMSYESRKIIAPAVDRLAAKLLFNSVIFHSTCMFRKAAFVHVGGYDEDQTLSEDYNLWVSFVKNGFQLANIKDVLVKYRMHPGENRAIYVESIRDGMISVWMRQLEHLGIKPSSWELDIHGSCASVKPETPGRVFEVEKWLNKLLHANMSSNYLPQRELELEFAEINNVMSNHISFFRSPLKYLFTYIFHMFIFICCVNGYRGKYLEKKIRLLFTFFKQTWHRLGFYWRA